MLAGDLSAYVLWNEFSAAPHTQNKKSFIM